ncbi:hypothetical protein Mpsy_3126 [Methanolobus psychrophilus R15]|nr:hypothetical protein Mpsy_3126 [Methanolobus psychrophilus R15]
MTENTTPQLSGFTEIIYSKTAKARFKILELRIATIDCTDSTDLHKEFTELMRKVCTMESIDELLKEAGINNAVITSEPLGYIMSESRNKIAPLYQQNYQYVGSSLEDINDIRTILSHHGYDLTDEEFEALEARLVYRESFYRPDCVADEETPKETNTKKTGRNSKKGGQK